MKTLLLLTCLFIALSDVAASDITYDIVLTGGRVMDPETNFDGLRNVGINGNKIAMITSNSIKGEKEIDVSGLVVAPGFIDLHVHGMTNKEHSYQIRDGVTTALELEGGVSFMKEWLASKANNSLVNFGATTSHSYLRTLAMSEFEENALEAKNIANREGVNSEKLAQIMKKMAPSAYASLEPNEIQKLRPLVLEQMEQGALGLGVPVGYYLGASPPEMFEIYTIAAELNAPVYSHTRGIGMSGIYEAIAYATTTGASLHIVHANSLSLGNIQTTLDLVHSAKKQGLDITTEVYPYTAASTYLASAIFDGDWQKTLGISYEDLQWQDTGERLTKYSYERYRKQDGIVIIHMMKPEWILKGIIDSETIISSDGMPYAEGAHPRTAGTFSRILGRYVRQQKVIGLMDALRKMTIMPAQRLQTVSPMMLQKGRLQVGADADITIFDPTTIIDKADFDGLHYSEGVKHAFVNGVHVVKNQEIVPDTYPGQAVIGKLKR